MTAVTERKRAEQAATRRTAELTALYDGARIVLTSTDFSSTTRRLFDDARTIISASAGCVALCGESGEENELLFLEPGDRRCNLDSSLSVQSRGLLAVACASGEVVVDNDFKSSSWASALPEGHVAPDNVLVAPLRVEDRTVGVIGFANTAAGFDDNDQDLAAATAQLAALGLQKWRADQMLRSERDRLQAVMQTAPIAILMADDQERIVQVNRAAEAP